jgi:hypothetical protein
MPALSSGGQFTQMHCDHTGCGQPGKCVNHSFPVGKCVHLEGGKSAIVHCRGEALEETIYASADCSGEAQRHSTPTNKCIKDEKGFHKSICSAESFRFDRRDAGRKGIQQTTAPLRTADRRTHKGGFRKL